MGRTKRKRKKRQTSTQCKEFSKIINLQRELKLKCPNIEIKYFSDTGWGVRCKKQIEEGEVLIALPLQHLITPGADCEIFSVLKFENQAPQFILSVFLTYEYHLQQKSKYFQYIRSLPESFTNPYFCTDKEIKLFPEFIKKEVLAQRISVESIIKELFQMINGKSCPHCEETLGNIFTHERVIWAWFVVNTRSVYYEDDNHANSLGLAPFLDLFNHSDDALTKMIIDYNNGFYILKTFVGYKKFDQVFIKYGAHSNLKLFVEYGFILNNNLNDFVEFSFQEVIESVREFDLNLGDVTKLKYKFIKSNKLNENLSKGLEFSWNFLGLIYVLVTKDQDISVLQSKTYSNEFDANENVLIEKICEVTSKNKIKQLNESLKKMESISNCTQGFQVAKNLIKNYMNLLHKL